MIIRFQVFVFFLVGVICWHGVDDLMTAARGDAKIEVLISLPIHSLTTIQTSDL